MKQFHHWLGVRESWKINLAKTKKTREWYLRFNEILQEVENSNLRKEIVLGNFIFSSREDEGLPAPVLYPLVTRRLTIELGVDQYNLC